ncbi:MAG: pyridoxal 5'-phosphate synthase glutaminase subunit PdxT [Proteobacteria bacterium]|nr:pyridoxal 5'-phosphate synthase glutaminase subunit PdxT [Pseudomonadota bacterium]
MRVGVLAIQGAFIEHERAFERAGHIVSEIRQSKDLEASLDMLVFPGGESTVQRKLLHDLHMTEPIWQRIDAGIGVYATCAGLILLANEVDGKPNELGRLSVLVQRNAYGRQLGSFQIHGSILGHQDIVMTFIRAPRILSAGQNVEILSTFDGYPTAVHQGNITAFAYHPELNGEIYL